MGMHTMETQNNILQQLHKQAVAHAQTLSHIACYEPFSFVVPASYNISCDKSPTINSKHGNAKCGNNNDIL